MLERPNLVAKVKAAIGKAHQQERSPASARQSSPRRSPRKFTGSNAQAGPSSAAGFVPILPVAEQEQVCAHPPDDRAACCDLPVTLPAQGEVMSNLESRLQEFLDKPSEVAPAVIKPAAKPAAKQAAANAAESEHAVGAGKKRRRADV